MVKVGNAWEAKGDYFANGDLAYQIQEIIGATEELLSSARRWGVEARRLDCRRGLGVDLAQAVGVVAAGGTFARANLQRASNQRDHDSAETVEVNKDAQGTSWKVGL